MSHPSEAKPDYASRVTIARRRHPEMTEEARAAERRATLEAFERSLVTSAGERYATATLESFQIAEPQQDAKGAAHRAVRSYLARAGFLHGQNLLLLGNSGTGKDHLAIGACKFIIREHGIQPAWVNAQRWFAEMRDAIDAGASEVDAIETLAEPNVLVLSDPRPAAGPCTDRQVNLLYGVLDSRYSRQRATIITANVADAENAKRVFGVPNWERMRGGAWVVEMFWPSWREPAAEYRKDGREIIR